MRRRSKVKLAFIENPTKRRATYKKRKQGLMKKLYELTTLCDIKACAVIYNPNEPTPEVWPSPEGVQEVVSKFMEMPESERCKWMLDHETYLRGRITKEHGQATKLSSKNTECLRRRFMYDYIEGRINLRQCDPRLFQDLSFFVDDYLNQLYSRRTYLTEHGEASSLPLVPTTFAEASSLPLVPTTFAEASSLPLVPTTFAEANPHVVADAGYGQFQYQNMNEPVQSHAPIGLNDQIQYQHEPVQPHVSAAFYGHMNHNQPEPVQYLAPIALNDQIQYQNMNQNQHELVQYHAPVGMNDLLVQYQNMNKNQNQHESVQYHAPTGLNDRIQYLNMNMNMNQNLNVSVQHQAPIGFSAQVQYQNMNMNQYQHEPVQYQPQEMGYVGEHAYIPFRDGYNQRPTGDLASTSSMPFITTSAATVGVHAPYFNNNL